MQWWNIALIVWVVALPLVAGLCAVLCRAGQVEDEAWLCRAAIRDEPDSPVREDDSERLVAESPSS